MQTSLQAIANKAEQNGSYRFGNLYTMLNRLNLEDSWQYMNRKAAPGVDSETVQDYEQNFAKNIPDLVERLKQKRYRARLVKRVNIPKDGDKVRPLGLPVIEDKLVQTAASRILNAIYEQDFLSCSHGYRPNRGPGEASKVLAKELNSNAYNWIVEADIKGFFDNIDHDWLIKMLERRVNDQAFLRLIRKWLKAGVLEATGEVLHPTAGTPQGGVISPVLANVYLHYVLDLWFQKVVKRHCEGVAYLCRFADDFVCAFESERDARRFYQVLGKRMAKFGLELAPEKTRLIPFQRNSGKESFDFLGFEYRWATSKRGNRWVKRRTSRTRLRKSVKNLKEWIKEKRFLKLGFMFHLLNLRLRGYYNYYGVIGNSQGLAEFFWHVRGMLFKWLNRRSQRRSYTWKGFFRMLDYYRIERPRIVEQSGSQLSFDSL